MAQPNDRGDRELFEEAVPDKPVDDFRFSMMLDRDLELLGFTDLYDFACPPDVENPREASGGQLKEWADKRASEFPFHLVERSAADRLAFHVGEILNSPVQRASYDAYLDWRRARQARPEEKTASRGPSPRRAEEPDGGRRAAGAALVSTLASAANASSASAGMSAPSSASVSGVDPSQAGHASAPTPAYASGRASGYATGTSVAGTSGAGAARGPASAAGGTRPAVTLHGAPPVPGEQREQPRKRSNPVGCIVFIVVLVLIISAPWLSSGMASCSSSGSGQREVEQVRPSSDHYVIYKELGILDSGTYTSEALGIQIAPEKPLEVCEVFAFDEDYECSYEIEGSSSFMVVESSRYFTESDITSGDLYHETTLNGVPCWTTVSSEPRDGMRAYYLLHGKRVVEIDVYYNDESELDLFLSAIQPLE